MVGWVGGRSEKGYLGVYKGNRGCEGIVERRTFVSG